MASMKATSAMRRSCNFCRSRKIRCSGQNICSACAERNIDCVYMREASKGRPKGSVFKNSRAAAATTKESADTSPRELLSAAVDGPESLTSPPLPSALSTPSKQPRSDPFNQPPRKAVASSNDNNDGTSLAADLEQMFNEDFKEINLSGDNEFQKSLAAFHHKIGKDAPATMGALLGFSIEDRQRRAMSYEQLLSTLAQELVEMLSIRFGSLGCHHLGNSSARFFAVCLAYDETPSMFTPPATARDDVLAEFDGHRTIQMIEVWFSAHPLSNIVSKTLFLRDYNQGAHDPILLAVMLADAIYAHDHDSAGEDQAALFRWATIQLRHRPAQNCGLSTAQVLMLLGWHELCLCRARRATCYLGYAGRVITRLHREIAEAPGTGFSQINGIDVGEVHAELIRNIYWLSFAITLWSFMQIDQPFSQLLPYTVPTEFPPLDQSSSTVMKLDIVSDNVSTLAMQSRMIQELWPLSHIASTTAHIYALFPREQDVDEAPQSVSWQSRPLHQLRRLLSLQQDISILCASIRKVLGSAVEVLEVKVENSLSKALVLTAYHTLIIHLLFPRTDSEHEDPVVVSEEMLADFCSSAKRLLETFSFVDADLNGSDRLITRARSSTFVDIFVLGLDVCGRAIDYIYTRTQQGSESECQIIAWKETELESIASQMHKIAKSETLLTANNLRPIKKKLKLVKSRFSDFKMGHTTTTCSSIDGDSRMFADSTIRTPSSSDFYTQTNQSMPDVQSNPRLEEMASHDFFAPLPDLWPENNLMDFSAWPGVVLAEGDGHGFHPIDWMDDGHSRKRSAENSTIWPALQDSAAPKHGEHAERGPDGVPAGFDVMSCSESRPS